MGLCSNGEGFDAVVLLGDGGTWLEAFWFGLLTGWTLCMRTGKRSKFEGSVRTREKFSQDKILEKRKAHIIIELKDLLLTPCHG